MSARRVRIFVVLIVVVLVMSCGKAEPTAPSSPTDPFPLISQQSLFAYLEELTKVQAYSGWRNSASEGEAEALDYVAARLGEFEVLKELGMRLERQDFRVFLGTELWETRLHLTVGGKEVEVPVDGLRGPSYNVTQALHFDSDGMLNDAQRDPMVVEGPLVLVHARSDLRDLDPPDVEGKIVFLNYATVDEALLGDTTGRFYRTLLDRNPAGLVLVTQFSNEQGKSHGSFVGDWTALDWTKKGSPPPVLYARLEDLAPAGITDWDDLAQVQKARLTWDADVFSPADSGNLVARIPGQDSSAAIILGAHIDSPNSPGALDDGSGSVVLLEVARVLDAAFVQPPVDVYLAWFGSEELGLYGSAHFVATHQELLDRTLAMLQIDCLTYPLDGIDANLDLVAWSYSRLGDDRLKWPDFLAEAAGLRGIQTFPEDLKEPLSDHSVFAGFDVPSADLIYGDEVTMKAAGGLHYAGHLHDPYDTVALAREVGDVLQQMAQVALIAALDTGRERPALRVAPTPDRRALFVGSHTEPVQMAPTTYVELGMALAWQGFDVDWVPNGQAVTAEDLADADLVFVLPVLDYANPDGDPTLNDEGWSQEEVDALQAYVADGGLLVLTNSAQRLWWGAEAADVNEDWADMNVLAARFGVSYEKGRSMSGTGFPKGDHPLMEGVRSLRLADQNGVPFTMSEGVVVAATIREPVAGLIDHGDAGGQVLVLADVGILGTRMDFPPVNLPFWQNLTSLARSR